MSDTSGKSNFQCELDRRLDELIAWAIASLPEKSSVLTAADFTDIRNSFYKALTISDDPFSREPEPSEGGAQYVNVSPAPWP
jgi:hypothetical protein